MGSADNVSYPNAIIHNFASRTDVTGAIMDVHDGNILFLDDTYYWFGASYGSCDESQNICLSVGCCGLRASCASSPAPR